jgi:acetyl esterase/lipase
VDGVSTQKKGNLGATDDPRRASNRWVVLQRRHLAALLSGSLLLASACARESSRVVPAGDAAGGYARSASRPAHRAAYGPAPLEFGDLFLPDGPGPHPVVVLVHGGCWLSRYDKSLVADVEQALPAKGFAVWSLEYRRLGDDGGGWPGTFQDVAQGTDFLRTLAMTYPLDLKRVVVAGHSAGGGLALWLAARGKVSASSEIHSSDPLPVIGVLALAPVPDYEGLEASGGCGRAMDRLLGGSPADRPDRYQAASPMKLAPIGVPQRIVVGGRDTEWAPYGRAYAARARAAGDQGAQLVEAPESGHFDVTDPTSSSWPVVVRSLEELFAAPGR